MSDAIERGDVAAWYDFPSRSMLAVYGRMRIPAKGEMVRLVYPLRIDEAVGTQVKGALVRRGLSAAGNVALRARDAFRTRDSSIEVRAFEDDFGAVSSIGDELEGGVSLERTPEYLVWRYRMDPSGPSSVLGAFRDGVCGGMLVYRAHPDRTAVVDAFGIRHETFLRELVIEVIERARQMGSNRITVGISAEHPWLRVFGELGFHRREGAPYVVYSRPQFPTDAPWFLMSGDRDV